LVNAQGAKVSLAVDQSCDAGVFDPVHQVEVKEQIWRWDGKPLQSGTGTTISAFTGCNYA
jgi:hypothetical protein